MKSMRHKRDRCCERSFCRMFFENKMFRSRTSVRFLVHADRLPGQQTAVFTDRQRLCHPNSHLLSLCALLFVSPLSTFACTCVFVLLLLLLLLLLQQESHTDLREWYVHCLDFRALKRRLIDDPPDPYDDHPSMAGPTEAQAATTSADARDPAPICSSSTASPSGGGRSLLVDPERDGLGASSAGEGNGRAREGWKMQRGERREDAGGVGGIQVVFPNPSSRVFVFEINQVGAVCMFSLRRILCQRYQQQYPLPGIFLYSTCALLRFCCGSSSVRCSDC